MESYQNQENYADGVSDYVLKNGINYQMIFHLDFHQNCSERRAIKALFKWLDKANRIHPKSMKKKVSAASFYEVGTLAKRPHYHLLLDTKIDLSSKEELHRAIQRLGTKAIMKDVISGRGQENNYSPEHTTQAELRGLAHSFYHHFALLGGYQGSMCRTKVIAEYDAMEWSKRHWCRFITNANRGKAVRYAAKKSIQNPWKVWTT